MRYFHTIFLEEANRFMIGLDSKVAKKVLYNIDLAEQTNDASLFKKLDKDIWEFRTRVAGLQIRLLAFWDKSSNIETLVITTHGFIKKTDKVKSYEIERAIKGRTQYFKNKK